MTDKPAEDGTRIPTTKEAFENAMAALGEAAGALTAIADLLTLHEDERVRRLGRQAAWAGTAASALGAAVDTAADGIPNETWDCPVQVSVEGPDEQAVDEVSADDEWDEGR